MRFEQLEYIAAVTQHGSLRRASERLHVSQPALSEAVQSLERELGVNLLDRRRSGSRISRQGRELLQNMVDVLEAVHRLRTAAGDQSHAARTLRVGTVNAGTSSVLIPAVGDLRRTDPDTVVEVVNIQHAEIHQGLAEGSLDLGLVNMLPGDDVPPDLHATELLHGHPAVCCRSDNPLASSTSVDLADLREQPFVAMRSGYVMHRFAHRLFGDRLPTTSYSTDGAEMGKLMVADGLGVTVLPLQHRRRSAGASRRDHAAASCARQHDGHVADDATSGQSRPGRSAESGGRAVAQGAELPARTERVSAMRWSIRRRLRQREPDTPRRLPHVRKILVTGMSGTGKSTALVELGERGHRVVDTDTDAWSHWVSLPDGSSDWVWRERAMQELLIGHRTGTLYVSGCKSNQGRFYPLFDEVVLLSAPAEVALARIARRDTNPYGNSEEQRTEILRNFATVEPRLRWTASAEIDASMPVADVVRELEEIGNRLDADL